MKTFPFVDASKVCSSTLSANVECFFDLVALKICTADSSRNGLVPEIYSLSVFFRCENYEGRMGKKAIGAGPWKNNNRSEPIDVRLFAEIRGGLPEYDASESPDVLLQHSFQ